MNISTGDLARIVSILLIILVGFLFAPRFATFENIRVILLSVAGLGIVTYGMTVVVISGEIDLSVAGTAALAGIVGALVIDTNSTFLVVGLTLATGAAIGFANGFLSTVFGIPSLIVTLAMLQILRSLASIVSNGQAFHPDSLVGFLWLGRGILFGIPISVITLILITIAMILFTRRTVYSRRLYATGGGIRAAHLSGVNTVRVKITAFVICGVTASLAGIFESARLSYIEPGAYVGMELEALAATVLGGAALAGGSGSIQGALLATLIIGLMQNLLNQLGVNFYLQQVVTALVILAVVLPGIRKRDIAK